MLKALAAAGDTDCSEAHAGALCLLGLWEKSAEYHPYIFYMGNDFRKLKAPFVWYDILHAADVLTRFECLRGDKRLLEMMDIIKAKSVGGRFTPESEWKAWKGWDFGQKKEPCAWLTFLAQRVLRRAECS